MKHRLDADAWLPITMLLTALAVFLAWHFAPIPAGADSGGYLNSARLLTEGKLKGKLRALPEWPLARAEPFTYVPLGFIDVQRTGKLIPSYPVGLPLHYALASRVAGWNGGTTLVGVLAALAAVFCTYRCLREFEVGPGMATAVSATLAASPMFLFVSLVPLSDTVATAWCTVAVLAALVSGRRPNAALLCGFALGVAVLVRPTNVLITPVVLILLPNARGWLRAAIAALPAVGFALWYNHAQYGSAFATGYGTVESLFQVQYLAAALRNYLTTLPVVLAIGFVTLALLPLLPWRTRRRELVGLVLWFPIFAGFYASYYYTGEYWWYLRFLLPAFPAIVILAGIGLNALQARIAAVHSRRVATTVIALLLGASLAVSVVAVRHKHVLTFPAEQLPHQTIPRWAQTHLPPDAAVFCFHLSSAFYFYTDFTILRSDQFTPEQFGRFNEAVRQSHRPVYAAIFRFDRTETFKDHIPGPWHKIADVADAEIWQLHPGP